MHSLNGCKQRHGIIMNYNDIQVSKFGCLQYWTITHTTSEIFTVQTKVNQFHLRKRCFCLLQMLTLEKQRSETTLQIISNMCLPTHPHIHLTYKRRISSSPRHIPQVPSPITCFWAVHWRSSYPVPDNLAASLTNSSSILWWLTVDKWEDAIVSY